MNYKEFGYKSEEIYFKDFYKTLLETNRTHAFFVNWEKVYTNLEKYLDEISLLNGLVNIKQKDKRFKHMEYILKQYPKTRTVIPLLVATREQNFNLLVIDRKGNITYKNINFSQGKIDDILDFCKKTKIIEMLGTIKDLYTYMLGVEVGSDTNARKNRSGTIFESLTLKALQTAGIDARKAVGKNNFGIREKRSDILIYKKGKIFAYVEVNFFNELGSKPLEIAQSYIKLQEDAITNKMKFIWITDGPAWKTGKVAREGAFSQINYIFNLKLAGRLIPKLVNK